MMGSIIPASVTVLIDLQLIFEWSIQTSNTQNSCINAESVPKFAHRMLGRVVGGKFTGRQHHSRQWQQLKRLYLTNGFSGHGLKQGYSAGRYLSELILEKPVFLDFFIFAPQRILDNRALSESELV